MFSKNSVFGAAPYRAAILQVMIPLFLMSAACTAVVHTTSGDWVSLGSATVKRAVDRDVISVNKAVSFDKLQLRVSRAAVVFRDVKVHFGDGSVQDVKVGRSIAAGGKTRVIDLRGDDRHIEKIVFWYRTPRRAHKLGVVTAFARR